MLRAREDFGVIVVAIHRDGEHMLFNPGAREQIFAGDVLVLMGHDEKLAELGRALRGLSG